MTRPDIGILFSSKWLINESGFRKYFICIQLPSLQKIFYLISDAVTTRAPSLPTPTTSRSTTTTARINPDVFRYDTIRPVIRTTPRTYVRHRTTGNLVPEFTFRAYKYKTCLVCSVMSREKNNYINICLNSSVVTIMRLTIKKNEFASNLYEVKLCLLK